MSNTANRTRAWVEIDLDAIRHNAALLRAALPVTALLAVVKADAYGHGLVPVSRAALRGGTAWLGVATVEEGLALRAALPRGRIALLCMAPPGSVCSAIAAGLVLTIGDRESVKVIADCASGAPAEAFLEIDTGMGRSGVRGEDAPDVWIAAKKAGISIIGISTHFSDADDDFEHTMYQAAQFTQVREALEKMGAHTDWVHLSNSAGIVANGAFGGNMMRAGLLIYGISPIAGDSAQRVRLRPALALKARLASVRQVPAGHSISYGRTHILERDSRVATVVIGYGDGYPRRLSNSGNMLIHGSRAPILGRICMDQTVVDVTDIPDADAGDIATCIGSDGDECITIEEIAERIDTTPHEIPVCLTARLPRIYI